MKLELLIKEIKDVEFGEKTEVKGDVLYVSLDELKKILEEDQRFESVDVYLTHPGEEKRIVNVTEVIEPRFRLDGINFPGILGQMKTVGSGQTTVLKGVAVVETNPYFGGALVNGEIDMVGKGSELTPYSKTNNIVLVCHPANKGINKFEYDWAIRRASLKTSVYLAQALKKDAFDYIEKYDLPPATEVCQNLGDLPRVGYLQQLISLQFEFSNDPYSLKEPYIYGGSPRGLMPIMLHPNEILDGAMMEGYGRGNFYSIYSLQNSAIIKDLYNRHGKDLCFVGGCIIVISPTDTTEKERIAAMSATMAKSVLGLDGIILGREWAGASETDQALQCEAMEAEGIKTVLISRGASVDKTLDNYVTILSHKANAIVSGGNGLDIISLPPISTVYGGKTFSLLSGTTFDAQGEMDVQLLNIVDAISLTGYSRVTTQIY